MQTFHSQLPQIIKNKSICFSYTFRINISNLETGIGEDRTKISNLETRIGEDRTKQSISFFCLAINLGPRLGDPHWPLANHTHHI